MITTFLLSASAFIGTVGLLVMWIYKRFVISSEVASNAAVRAERLKPIDEAITKNQSEAKSVESKTEDYEREYGVKLVHPTDDSSGSK